MTRPALLLLGIVLAGCAAPPDAPIPVEPAGATPPEAEAAEASAPEGLAAPPPAVLVAIPFSAEGSTEGEACPALGSVERCVATATPRGTPVEIPVVERPVLLELAIEVDEPAHAKGCAFALLRVREGDGWRTLGDEGLVALGGSPLSVEWPLDAFPPRSAFHVAVHCGGEAREEGPVRAYVGWEARFRLTGALHHET